MGSSCSQKVRIFLNLKGIDWESHTIDLLANENVEPWFLGINPRGLAPVLVHNGGVHIESNDIIQYLENVFPNLDSHPPAVRRRLRLCSKHEDDLHLDLRTLSFRFVFNPPGPPKTPEQLKKYRANGTGTVRGQKDGDRERFNSSGGSEPPKKKAIRTTGRAQRRRSSAPNSASLDERLAKHPYLLGQNLTVLDIAWLIYAHRLSLAGYPFARLHPRVDTFVQKLRATPRIRQGGRDTARVRCPPSGHARG